MGRYLRLVQATVDMARLETGASQVSLKDAASLAGTWGMTTTNAMPVQVTLLGHSAGGWLARAFVADPLYFESAPSAPGSPHAGVSSTSWGGLCDCWCSRGLSSCWPCAGVQHHHAGHPPDATPCWQGARRHWRRPELRAQDHARHAWTMLRHSCIIRQASVLAEGPLDLHRGVVPVPGCALHLLRWQGGVGEPAGLLHSALQLQQLQTGAHRPAEAQDLLGCS